METNEKSNKAGASSKTKPYTFLAHVVSVDFVDSEKLTRDGAEFKGPHWTLAEAEKKECKENWAARGKRVSVRRKWYSKKPAAYTVKTIGDKKKVTVQVEVTKSENVSGSAKLVGILGAIRIEGTCKGTSVGPYTVEAEIKAWNDPCDHIDSCVGNISWSLILSSPEGNEPLGSTFVELYLLLATPIMPMYGSGLPAEVLRLLFQKPLTLGLKEPMDIAARVTFYFHKRHGPKYDIEEGDTSYDVKPAGSTSDFHAANCALKWAEKVNCYDQAATVQTMCGAIGIEVKFVFMEPFGYINGTHLVGWIGLCNNPFPGAPGIGRRLPTFSYLEKKNLDNPIRSYFCNHAFAELDGKILDACAGPHQGTETTADYIREAIDKDTKLNMGSVRYYYSHFPGNDGDAKPKSGVIGVKQEIGV
jgi:hypothetical protein